MPTSEPHPGSLQLISPVFREGTSIPIQYTCRGSGVSMPLNILDAPLETQSFALILHDPDAPAGDFLHWLMWDIPSSTEIIAANSVPVGAVQGLNGLEETGYVPPCPPAGSGTHRYVFELYALDTTLDLPSESGKEEVQQAMKDHVIDETTLTGIFSATS